MAATAHQPEGLLTRILNSGWNGQSPCQLFCSECMIIGPSALGLPVDMVVLPEILTWFLQLRYKGERSAGV